VKAIGIVGVFCVLLSGSLVAPVRAVNFNFSTLDCQQTDLPQTDLIRTANGIRTLDNVDTPRYVSCSMGRSPYTPTATSSFGFYIDGDNRNGASTTCVISAYTYYGALMGSTSIVTNPGPPSFYSYYDYSVFPPADQSPAWYSTWNYITLNCLLPAHGDGVLRGVTAVQ
jgi:hypothetical protein